MPKAVEYVKELSRRVTSKIDLVMFLKLNPDVDVLRCHGLTTIAE